MREGFAPNCDNLGLKGEETWFEKVIERGVKIVCRVLSAISEVLALRSELLLHPLFHSAFFSTEILNVEGNDVAFI